MQRFLSIFPPTIQHKLSSHPNQEDLIEVVLDLGRPSSARFLHGEEIILPQETTATDLQTVLDRLSEFGADNRAGINRTLHRISAIRNRKGTIIGLTCRVGRAIAGSANLIDDIIQSGQSFLLLGPPGVGKTTILRETARILADKHSKRVVIVDTSNEIGGDGDIPHPAIGRARRMPVLHPDNQHAIMIEAVENHMPEAIVIDEMGTSLEAQAARTIAERGVQLVATAHGMNLENLLINPTLNDLLGGIQSVTLGDEEARRRGTQKSILERQAPPTFDVLIEIVSRNEVIIHPQLQEAVDLILRQQTPPYEHRKLLPNGKIQTEKIGFAPPEKTKKAERNEAPPPLKIFPFGISKAHLQKASKITKYPINLVKNVQEAQTIIINKKNYRKRGKRIREAEKKGIPLYIVADNSQAQATACLKSIVK